MVNAPLDPEHWSFRPEKREMSQEDREGQEGIGMLRPVV
jgi:hypothetical protein